MASYINSTVNKNIDIRIDLDQAGIISLVPIISIPGFVIDILQSERFI